MAERKGIDFNPYETSGRMGGNGERNEPDIPPHPLGAAFDPRSVWSLLKDSGVCKLVQEKVLTAKELQVYLTAKELLREQVDLTAEELRWIKDRYQRLTNGSPHHTTKRADIEELVDQGVIPDEVAVAFNSMPEELDKEREIGQMIAEVIILSSRPFMNVADNTTDAVLRLMNLHKRITDGLPKSIRCRVSPRNEWTTYANEHNLQHLPQREQYVLWLANQLFPMDFLEACYKATGNSAFRELMDYFEYVAEKLKYGPLRHALSLGISTGFDSTLASSNNQARYDLLGLLALLKPSLIGVDTLAFNDQNYLRSLLMRLVTFFLYLDETSNTFSSHKNGGTPIDMNELINALVRSGVERSELHTITEGTKSIIPLISLVLLVMKGWPIALVVAIAGYGGTHATKMLYERWVRDVRKKFITVNREMRNRTGPDALTMLYQKTGPSSHFMQKVENERNPLTARINAIDKACQELLPLLYKIILAGFNVPMALVLYIVNILHSLTLKEAASKGRLDLYDSLTKDQLEQLMHMLTSTEGDPWNFPGMERAHRTTDERIVPNHDDALTLGPEIDTPVGKVGTGGEPIHVPKGTALLVVGDNGSGKTSFIKTTIGEVTGGSNHDYAIAGRPASELGAQEQRDYFVYINPDTYDLPNYIRMLILNPWYNHSFRDFFSDDDAITDWIAHGGIDVDSKIVDYMHNHGVYLFNSEHIRGKSVSGAQQFLIKLALLGGIRNNQIIYVLDEPNAKMEREFEKRLWGWVATMNREGKTVITVINHNIVDAIWQKEITISAIVNMNASPQIMSADSPHDGTLYRSSIIRDIAMIHHLGGEQSSRLLDRLHQGILKAKGCEVSCSHMEFAALIQRQEETHMSQLKEICKSLNDILRHLKIPNIPPIHGISSMDIGILVEQYFGLLDRVSEQSDGDMDPLADVYRIELNRLVKHVSRYKGEVVYYNMLAGSNKHRWLQELHYRSLPEAVTFFLALFNQLNGFALFHKGDDPPIEVVISAISMFHDYEDEKHRLSLSQVIRYVIERFVLNTDLTPEQRSDKQRVELMHALLEFKRVYTYLHGLLSDYLNSVEGDLQMQIIADTGLGWFPGIDNNVDPIMDVLNMVETSWLKDQIRRAEVVRRVGEDNRNRESGLSDYLHYPKVIDPRKTHAMEEWRIHMHILPEVDIGTILDSGMKYQSGFYSFIKEIYASLVLDMSRLGIDYQNSPHSLCGYMQSIIDIERQCIDQLPQFITDNLPPGVSPEHFYMGHLDGLTSSPCLMDKEKEILKKWTNIATSLLAFHRGNNNFKNDFINGIPLISKLFLERKLVSLNPDESLETIILGYLEAYNQLFSFLLHIDEWPEVRKDDLWLALVNNIPEQYGQLLQDIVKNIFTLSIEDTTIQLDQLHRFASAIIRYEQIQRAVVAHCAIPYDSSIRGHDHILSDTDLYRMFGLQHMLIG